MAERVRADFKSSLKVVYTVRQATETGDLVWIVEPTRTRGYYPLARVVKLNFGSDAVVRSAEVKTMSGNLVRPVVKLAPVLPPPDLPDLS